MAEAAFALRVVLKDETALLQLRAARKVMNRHVREALLAAAERSAVPAVRAVAPHKSGRLADSLVARGGLSGVYITSTIDKRLRYPGMLQFGGVSRGVIRPRNRHALLLGPGLYRASVKKRRRYEGRHYMERGIGAANERIWAELRVAMERSLTEAVSGVVGGPD